MKTNTTNTNATINFINIFAVLGNNKLTKSDDFVINGNTSDSETKAAKTYFAEYKTLCKEIAERGNLYAYMNMHFSNRNNKTVTEKTLADIKALYNKLAIEASDAEITYTLKQMVNRLNSDKKTLDGSKRFGTVISYATNKSNANTIKTAFERTVSDIIRNVDYVTANERISNSLHNKEVFKLIEICYELARKGKTKALDNHFNKLEKLVDKNTAFDRNEFDRLKAEISATVVTVEKTPAETPVTTDTPTAETTDTTSAA